MEMDFAECTLYRLPNPYLDENGWWWYDEAEQISGPYDTEAEASAVLNSYVANVLGYGDDPMVGGAPDYPTTSTPEPEVDLPRG